MTNQQKITEFSWEVNGLLSQYVVIHDDIFKTSIRHIIPIPGIFKAIDFGAHLGRAENIISELESCGEKIKLLAESSSGQGREYLVLLSQYVGTLIETVSCLKVVVEALYAKSQSFANSNYDWKNYKNDLAKYDQSVRDYMLIGVHLNELFEKIK